MPLFGGDKERRKPAPGAPAEPPRAAQADGRIDALTGVLAREGIEAEGTSALAAVPGGENVAVGYVGFDGLRELVDRAGHLVADQLLRELGKRLRDVVREGDAVGRLNADEFLIVFRKLSGRLETLALVSRMRIALAEPIRGGAGTYKPIVNCGLAHPPGDGTTIEALLDASRTAMLGVREAAREVARTDATQRLEAARGGIAHAAAELAAAEQGVREAERRIDLAKAGVSEAKAALQAASDHAKSVGIPLDAPGAPAERTPR